MPSKYTCNGGETSPNLQWSISSDAVKGFALIMEDPDAVPIVGYAYVHWNVFGIPATARELAEGASRKHAGRQRGGPQRRPRGSLLGPLPAGWQWHAPPASRSTP